MKTFLFIVGLLIVGFVGYDATFTLDQTEQAIITQLERYVLTVDRPGLYLKVPFLQTAHHFEKRLLRFNAPAAAATAVPTPTVAPRP